MFTHVYIAEVRDHADFASLQARRAFVGTDKYAALRVAQAWAIYEAGVLEGKQEDAGCQPVNIAWRVFSVECVEVR